MSNSSNSSTAEFSCDGMGRPSGSATTVLIAFSYAVLIPLIVFGNGLVVIAFVINQKLRTATNIFICGLGLSDLLIGVFSLPYWTYISTLNSLMDAYCDPLYEVYICIDIGTGCASILQLTSIAIERLYFTVAPLKHRRLRRSVYWYMLAIAWIFSILAAGLQPLQAKSNWHNQYSLFLFVSCFLFPLIIIIVVYAYIFKVSRDQSRRRSSTQTRIGSTGGNIKEFNMFVTVLVITGVFIIAWAPFFMTTVIATFCPLCIFRIQSEHLIRFVKWMQYSSSAINPYIYAYRNEEVRSFFKKVLRLCLCNGCQDVSRRASQSSSSQTHRGKHNNNNKNSSSQTASKESVENGTIVNRLPQSLASEDIPECYSRRVPISSPSDGRLKDIQNCFDNQGFTYPNVSKQRNDESDQYVSKYNQKIQAKSPDICTQDAERKNTRKTCFDSERLANPNSPQKRTEKVNKSPERNWQRKEDHTRRSNEFRNERRRDFSEKQSEKQTERRKKSSNDFDKGKIYYGNEAPLKRPRGVSLSQQRERQKTPEGRSYDNSTETGDGKKRHSVGRHSDHFQSRQSYQNSNYRSEKRNRHHVRGFDNPVDITHEMSSTYV